MIAAWALGFAMLALPLPGPAQAQGRKIVLLSWGGIWADGMKAAFFDPFEKATGVHVELRPQGGMMDSLAKLKATKGANDIDLWFAGMTPTLLADQDGLLLPIPKASLTNASLIPPEHIADKYVEPWFIFYGVAYNRSTIPFAIHSWNDLLDPRLRGRVTIPTAASYSGKFLITLAWLAGGDEAHMDGAFALGRKLMPNVGVVFQSDTDAIKLLTSGEVDAAAMMPVGNFVKIQQAGPQYAFVAPGPHSPIASTTMMLLKGQNSPDAIRFIDFVLGTTAQTEFAKRLEVIPANTKAEIPDDLKALTPAPGVLSAPDEKRAADELSAWSDRWDREVVK